MTADPIGLIAGWGRFPVLFAQKAQSPEDAEVLPT
mgnify:CR=1 FL=1